ncbi:MAG: PAS domain-containing sensor histidine kinase [Muribaculaceae bacterium]|jgi:two-component sensor histidine kinase|nr:PAS domain-containing sensor histidine kinase [Muribaculaceae bacterium]
MDRQSVIIRIPLLLVVIVVGLMLAFFIDTKIYNDQFTDAAIAFTGLAIGVVAIIIVLFYVSITERQKKKLLKYETTLEFAIASDNLSAWTINLDTKKMSIIFGRKDFHGIHTIEDLRERMHPDDLPAFNSLYEEFMMGVRTKADFNYRILLNEDEEYSHISNHMSLIEDDEGHGRVVVGILRDNTADVKKILAVDNFRRKMERVTAASGITIMQYNVAEHKFIHWNASGDSVFRTFLLEEYWRYIIPEDLPIAKRLVDVMNGQREQFYSCEYRYMLPGSHEYSWQFNDIYAYERDKEGKITSYIGVCRRNNSWHKTMDEMAKMRDNAEQANRLKSAFIANMSHEIRTPLNSIVGFSELLTGEEASDEEKSMYKNNIQTNSDRLLKLVNDILQLSQIESGFADINPSVFDISVFFKEIADEVSPSMPPGVKLNCNCSFSGLIHADRVRLRTIVDNFLSNAIKFTANGSITMDYAKKDKGITISVADTGIGISDENQKRIFGDFEKINVFSEGTGLGLSICKALVKVLKGKIGVTSKLGEGSTFWIWVPCQLISYGDNTSSSTISVGEASVEGTPEKKTAE